MTTGLLDHADELFAALAEPNRRLLLERLGTHGVATATTLAAELPVTRQAVTQHLAVLESVDLVSSTKACCTHRLNRKGYLVLGRDSRHTFTIEYA